MSLPNSPGKKKAIIAGLASQVGLKLQHETEMKTRMTVAKEFEEDLYNFYL